MLLMLLLPAAAMLRPAVVRAEPPEDSAIEMLQDASDALADAEYDIAREVFQQLILSYPGTPEAIRAEHELVILNSRQGFRSDTGTVTFFNQHTQEPQLRRRFAVDVGDRVFFAQSSAAIGGRARVMIENQARWLKEHPDLKVTIIGRADDEVAAADAMSISAERAEAVRQRLIAAGVDAARISVEARGLTDPVATCRTPLCQAENRIAETWIGQLRGVGLNDAATRRQTSVSEDATASRIRRDGALPR